MSEKIKPHHLERGAHVYVRQSTPYQIRNHLESKERQFALTERARQLGLANLWSSIRTWAVPVAGCKSDQASQYFLY